MATNKPPRLLVCCNSLAYFLAHRLAPALLARREGFEVHVAARADADPEALSSLGLAFHPIPLARHRLAPLSDLRAAYAVRRLVGALQPDAMHAITLKAALVTLTGLPGKAPRRLIVTFPGLGRVYSDSSGAWPALRKRIVTALLRRHFRRNAALVSFENEADRDALVGLGVVAREKTVLMRGTGIDLARFAPHPAGERRQEAPPCVLFAGRLLRQKGVVDFLEAAQSYSARMRDEGWPPARFAMAGAPDPGNRDSIDARRLKTLSAGGGVELLGQVADMPALLRGVDLVCLPTRYGEGLPRILLEAAACAVPAVASNLAGCREIVVDGKTGHLVPPGDPQALLEALRGLIADEALRARMGRDARKRVEEGGFDEETIARAFLAVYRGD